VREIYIDTAVVGTGAAGYNAADWLHALGRRDIAIVTEGKNMGTSRNAGSDKQTYYKLSISGSERDSVLDLAETLYNGGCVNGDTALIEAACSAKCFFKLANMGVTFPVNGYGEYVGYQTDHDTRKRATSAGPLTSKLMTEALEASVMDKGIKIIDTTRVIKLIISGNTLKGMLCIDVNSGEETVIFCSNAILATGGPAGIYKDSVYPASQTGSLGLAINAGVETVNLQEWQYGIASTKFRWNLSGTYQQVLPRYIAIDKNGNEREFLPEYFNNSVEALNTVFQKGYQWPFDSAKISASSQIDLILHKEIHEKGNKIYLDYRTDPAGLENGFGGLSEEARGYLEKSGALLKTPIARLAKMNPKAIELYKNNGIDLYKEPLEIAVCAQHMNGGIAVDANWQTNIRGLYAAGECAGTFGVYRPGGSALNSGQVGSMRAAEHICKATVGHTPEKVFFDRYSVKIDSGNKSGPDEAVEYIRSNMSKSAAYSRNAEEMKALFLEISELHKNFFEMVQIKDKNEPAKLYIAYDAVSAASAVLSAMIYAADKIGTRGGSIIRDQETGVRSQGQGFDMLTVTKGFDTTEKPVRPLPVSEQWFEAVYNSRP